MSADEFMSNAKGWSRLGQTCDWGHGAGWCSSLLLPIYMYLSMYAVPGLVIVVV